MPLEPKLKHRLLMLADMGAVTANEAPLIQHDLFKLKARGFALRTIDGHWYCTVYGRNTAEEIRNGKRGQPARGSSDGER